MIQVLSQNTTSNGFSAESRCQVAGVTRSWRTDTDRKEQERKLDEFAAGHGIKSYNNFAAMASSTDIDAVVVSSINPYHFNQIMLALDHGKHVLAEKPVVRTLKELQTISSKAAEKGLCLMPAHNFAYRGAVLEAKKLINAGKLGTIQYGSFHSKLFSPTAFRRSMARPARKRLGWKPNGFRDSSGVSNRSINWNSAQSSGFYCQKCL